MLTSAFIERVRKWKLFEIWDQQVMDISQIYLWDMTLWVICGFWTGFAAELERGVNALLSMSAIFHQKSEFFENQIFDQIWFVWARKTSCVSYRVIRTLLSEIRGSELNHTKINKFLIQHAFLSKLTARYVGTVGNIVHFPRRPNWLHGMFVRSERESIFHAVRIAARSETESISRAVQIACTVCLYGHKLKALPTRSKLTAFWFRRTIFGLFSKMFLWNNL